ncbi:MAG: hypothetical protein ACFCU3_09170 [Verrucomicrobiales bacterium]
MKTDNIITALKCLLAIIVCSPSIALSENLFRNGDMSTASGWRGDRSFVELDGQRVLELKSNPRREQLFFQDVKTGRIKDVVLTFQYMSNDYAGRGLQLLGERTDGSHTYRNLDLKVDGQWHDCTWHFSEIRGSRSMIFRFKLLEGNGSVFFRDVVLKEK